MKFSALSNKIKTRLRKALVVTATVLTAVAGANFTALPANAAMAYNFTSWTFTPCGQTGRTGPTLAMCQTAYSGSSFASNSTYFTVDANGNQIWKPPTTGYYRFEIAGAGGGGTNGGNGNVISFTQNLTTLNWACFMIGQKGVAATNFPAVGGGGGSTHMAWVGSAACSSAGNTFAGGGGGGGTNFSPNSNAGSAVNNTTSWITVPANAGAGTNGGAGRTVPTNIGSPSTDCSPLGGPLTGASGGYGCGSAAGQNTAVGVNAMVVARSIGNLNQAIGAGTFGMGLGGDGGYPNGGATCGCYINGGGGGGGGAGGGGGGLNADGTAGGGGGGSSIIAAGGIDLGAINSGDGYIKVTYDYALNADPSLTPGVAGTPRVGQSWSGPTPTYPQTTGSAPTYSYQWQTNTSSSLGAWTDIAGETSASYTVTSDIAGGYARLLYKITSPSGVTQTYASAWIGPINYTHAVTNASPPDGMRGVAYSFQLTSGPYAYTNYYWSLSSGTLPPGLTINASTGILGGTPTTAGTYTFVLAHDNKYAVALSQTYTVVIQPSGSIAFDPYTGPTAITGDYVFNYQFTTTSTVGPVTYSLSSGSLPAGTTLSPSGLLSGTVVGPFSAASPYTFSVLATASSTIFVASSSITVTVSPKTASGNATITAPAASTWNLTTAPTTSIPFTPAATGSGSYSYVTTTPTICSITSDGVSSPITAVALQPGTCTVRLTQAGNATYNAAYQNTNWTINKITQAAVTLTYTGSVAVGGGGFTNGYTGGSGTGAVTWGVGAGSPCLVDPITSYTTVIGPGTCTITFTKAADANYAAYTTSVSKILSGIAQTTPAIITNAPASIAFTDSLTLTASGGDRTLGFTSNLYGFVSRTTTTCTVNSATGVITVKLTGACTVYVYALANGVYLTGANSPDYSFNIVGTDQTPLTLTEFTVGQSFVAGGTAPRYTAGGGSGTISYVYTIDSSSTAICSKSSFSGSALYLAGLTAGTCTVWVSNAASGSYNAASAMFSFTVTKANQAAITLTATPNSITYNATTPATSTITIATGSPTSSGAKSYAIDPASAGICSVNASTGVATAIMPGTCVIVGTVAGNGTYNDITGTVSLTINKASQASVVTVSANRTVLASSDTTSLIVTATGGSGTGAYVYGTSSPTICSVDSATGVVTAVAYGNCFVTAYRAGDSYYNSTTASSPITITVSKLTQATFTASSTVTSTTYGSGTFTVSVTGGSGTGGTTYASGNTAICTVAATGVTTIVAPGACVITATKATDTNYLAATASVTITIAKGTQATYTASSTKTSVTIGATTGITVSASGGGGTGTATSSTFASGDTSVCTVNATTGVVTVLTAGACVITATRTGGTNYNDATSSVTITIAKTAQATVVATANRTTGTYGDGLTYSVTGSGGSGTGSFSYASNSASVCSVDSASGVVTILTAGTCSITATKASDASYATGSGTATITIAKASQSAIIASVDNAAPAYTENPWATAQVSYTGGSSTGAVTYSTTNTTICSVDSATGLVTDIAKGKCIVTVSIAADSNYNAASASVTIRFGKLDQAAVTASSTRTSVVYGAGSSITVSLTGGSGTGSISFATSSANCSVNASTGVVTYTNVGDCVITATKAGDIDYAEASSSVTITVTKANQGSIVATASSTSTTFNSGDSITVSYTGGSGTGAISYSTSSTTCSVDGSTGDVTLLGAGNCIVTVTKAADANYTEASSNVTISIAKSPQATVTATPSRSTGVYADAVSTTVSGSGGSGTGSFSYASTTASVCSVNASTGAVTILTAGTCSITATKAADTNYNAATGSTSIVVSKATQATVTATKSANTTYGSATQIMVTGSGGSGTGSFSYASTTTGICTINATNGVIAIVSAGDCVLTATKAADTNYNSASGNVTITIAKATQAAVTASATRTTSTYADGTSNTVALSGGSGTGATSFASTTASVCSIDATTGVLTVLTAGTCSITVTKAADTNYNVATASITITINKATQATFTVSIAPSNSTFGSATTVTISGTGGSGTGSVSYATTTASVCSVNASTGVITIVTAGTCSVTATKAADTNYNVASGSTSVVIGKATQSTLTLTPANSSVVFGDGQSANVTAAGGSGTGSVTYASNSTGICSVNSTTGAVTILTAGTCSITATKATDTNYNSATASASITVAKAAQASVVVSGNQSLTFSTSNPTSQLSVTGGSGTGSVSYDTATASVCVVSAGGLVTGLHAGTCVINATKAADTNYNSATASYTITIAKSAQATLVVSGSANLNYSASNAVTTQLNVTGGSSTGAVSFSVDSTSTTVCSVSANGLVTVLTAGTCLINVTKAGDADYLDRSTSFTVNIAKANQATLIVRTAGDLNYNPTTPATTTVSISAGGSGNGSATFSTTSTACSVVGNVVTALGAGSCVIDVTKAGDTNYNSATTSYSITVLKALQTALTATPSRTTLKFGDLANNSATVDLTGGSGTGSVNWFVDPTTTGVCSVDFSATPAVVTAITGGTCKVNITKAGDDNFAPIATSVTFTIQKNAQSAITVSATKTTAIKGETSTLSAAGGSTAGNISYSVVTGSTVCSINGSTLTFIGAGTCTVKATRAGDANYDAVDSTPISLSATKAEQSQLVVTQSAGMLPNVAIGGKSSTSWNVSGGNGDGAITVSSVSGCYAEVNGSVLTATAGASAGNCTIDIEKAESNDYRSTTYRVSLTVFELASTPQIQSPVLTAASTADGVQVQIPWTLPNTGNFIAPVTGYEVQTKTGSNWQVADGGTVTDRAATSVTISVTPWTSMYVRVAALSAYATNNSRAWSTFGGATAQAFTVPGLVTQLSVVSVPAAAIDSVVVTGAGFNPTLTPTVLLESSKPVFMIAGVAQTSIQVPATVTSPTQLSFRLPGEKLPTGTDSLDISVKVVATNSMQSTAGTFQITAGEESVDTGLDPNTGKMTPKINTQYEGTYTWSFTSATKEKIFTSYQCVKSVKVKTKTVCKLYNWVDSTTCTLTQVMPKNTKTTRRVVKFTTSCQLTPAAKNALKSANPPKVVASAKFVKLYPKTHLGWILVKGKKTAILKPSVRTLTITLRA
jgi:hypothetical protein